MTSMPNRTKAAAKRTVGKPPESWGHLIRQRRAVLNMSQTELAENVGISLVSMNRIEKGNQTPRLELMKRIARELRIDDLNDLFPWPRVD